MYNKFYKKTIDERINTLQKDNRFDVKFNQTLDQTIANNMIENYITNYEIPMGVAMNFSINGEDIIIPMVTEEPSVIAAASNAAKIMKQNGGIHARVIKRVMTGQIAFLNPNNIEDIIASITHDFASYKSIADNAYPSIVKRGGGLDQLTYEIKKHNEGAIFLIIYAAIDTKEAMGANMINTILEALSTEFTTRFNDVPTMSILSNLATDCLVEASVSIDPQSLKNSETIGKRIEAASFLAEVDPYRASTHNKGIMNGIDAVVISTGNDWRAIEASVHAYASLSGQYLPLTKWRYVDGIIKGSIILPMPVGFVGGSMGIHPKAQLARKIMNIDSAESLMMVIASVGLAQNFASIYALTTDGIQKGHMRLHARTLAIAVGCPEPLIDRLVEVLIDSPTMNLDTAKSLLLSIL